MFFRRAADTVSTPDTTTPTITLPRRSGAHEIAARELATLRERRAEISDEMIDRHRKRDPNQVGDRAIERLDAERSTIDDAIRAARETLAPLRAAHGSATEKALRPAIAAAAQALVDALEATVERRADLVRLVKHVELAAGEARPVAELDAAVLLRQARRLAIGK